MSNNFPPQEILEARRKHVFAITSNACNTINGQISHLMALGKETLQIPGITKEQKAEVFQQVKATVEKYGDMVAEMQTEYQQRTAGTTPDT